MTTEPDFCPLIGCNDESSTTKKFGLGYLGCNSHEPDCCVYRREFCLHFGRLLGYFYSSWYYKLQSTSHSPYPNCLQLRARRALSISQDVPLRTRRALSLYNVSGDSALLVLNRTSLNSDSALLSLN